MNITITSARNILGCISAIEAQQFESVSRYLLVKFGIDGINMLEEWIHDIQYSADIRAIYNSLSSDTDINESDFISTVVSIIGQDNFILCGAAQTENVVPLNPRKAQHEKEKQQKAKRLESQFNLLNNFVRGRTNNYLRSKQLLEFDISPFITLKVGNDRNSRSLGEFIAWPVFDLVTDEFRGYERIYDNPVPDDKGRIRYKKLTQSGTATKGAGYVFGNPETAEYIFVMGGLADGLSSHAASRECIVSVIGESNIPYACRLLKARYPNAIIVGAPDNDRAGLDQAYKALMPNAVFHNKLEDYIQSSGKFTVPQEVGHDWSDVFVQFGPIELRRQLKSYIRGYDINVVNQDKLNISLTPGLSLIRSGKGTGKSTSTAEFVKSHHELKTLIISYRVSLTAALAKQFEADWYQDLVIKDGNTGGDKNHLLKTSNRLVITPDSLHRLAGALDSYDVVFVDECDQTLQAFLSDVMKHKSQNLDALRAALSNAKYAILADADLSDLTIGFCKEIGLHKGTFHINEFKPRTGSTIRIYETREHVTESFIDHVAKGNQSVMACSAKEHTKVINEQLLIQERLRDSDVREGRTLSVHGDNSSDEQQLDFINNCNEPTDLCGAAQTLSQYYDAVVYSPSIGTGLSVDQPHNVKQVFGAFRHSPISAESAHQMLARWRDVNDYHVWLDSAELDVIDDPKVIKRLKLEMPTERTMVWLGIDPASGQAKFADSLYEWLYIHVESFNAINRNNFKKRFLEIAEAEGYTIEFIDKDTFQHDIGKSRHEAAREKLDKDLMESLLSPENPVLTEEEKELAELGELNVSNASILKTNVTKWLNFTFYKGDDAWEKLAHLTFEEEKQRYVHKVMKASLVNLPDFYVKHLDQKNLEHAMSRSDIRHLAGQKRLITYLFNAAGIDENFNYRGKQWSDKELRQKLPRWLKNNKDALFTYLNRNVTFDSKRQPVRWFHDTLKSFGISAEIIKKTDGGKTRIYGVEQGSLDKLRELAVLRNKGIIDDIDAELNGFEKVAPDVTNINKLVGVDATNNSPIEPSLLKDLRVSEKDTDMHVFDVEELRQKTAPELSEDTLLRIDLNNEDWKKLNSKLQSELVKVVDQISSIPLHQEDKHKVLSNFLVPSDIIELKDNEISLESLSETFINTISLDMPVKQLTRIRVAAESTGVGVIFALRQLDFQDIDDIRYSTMSDKYLLRLFGQAKEERKKVG